MRLTGIILCIVLLLTGAVVLSVSAQTTLQQRSGLPAFFKKLKAGKPVSIVYLGGSITQAAGYRVKSAAALKKQFPASTIASFNAGVGGTGSDLGLFRLAEDVLIHQPDLVFVEFAVNDYGSDTARIARSVEGIVRQLKTTGQHIEICFLYTISEAMLEDYRASRLPLSVRMMEQVAAWYGVPSVNFAPEVLTMRKEGKLVFHGAAAKQGKDPIVFSADGTHPLDAGYEIYTGTLMRSFAVLAEIKKKPVHLPAAKFKAQTDWVGRYNPDHFKLSSGWTKVSTKDALNNFRAVFRGLCYSSDSQDSLVVEFEGTQFGIEDVIGPASNGFLIQIDGRAAFKVTRFDKYCSRYRRHYFLLDPLPLGKHHIVVRPDFSSLDKQAILKADDREDFNRSDSRSQRMYLGTILVAGKVPLR